MAIPPDQRLRSIGFLLTGGPDGDVQFDFGLRPEDLSVSEPMRIQVQQTLGGAWADAFDRGVATITLAGTCGWRGSLFQPGEDLFQGLRDTVFQGWSDARSAAIAQGEDPDNVRLYFTDSLDKITALVAPRNFTLRRSRTSPLLMRYNISLLVLDDASGPDIEIDPIVLALSGPQRFVTALASLQNSVATITTSLAQARAFFGGLTATVVGFINLGVSLIRGVIGIAIGVVQEVTLTVQAFLDVGVQIARAAASGLNAIASDGSLLAAEVMSIGQIGNMFRDAGCAIEAAFDSIGKFPSWDAFRGASGCSSTAGGDPISVFTAQDVTPFAYLVPSIPPMVTVTPDAGAALALMQADPLIAAPNPAAMADLMLRVNQGVTVA